MAHYEWTANQQMALDARKSDLAVSAAAGSGKTAVLTERIVRLLSEENGIRADRLAVVTFTKAAASELEERLYQKLSDAVAEDPHNAHLSGQLFRLAGAQISTIHSFCFTLIRNHRKELGLQEKVHIGDPTECAILLKRSAEDALEEFLSEPSEEERKKKEAFVCLFHKKGDDSGIIGEILELFKKVSSLPGGLSLLEELFEKRRIDLQKRSLTGAKDLFREELRTVLKKAEGILEVLILSSENYPVLSSLYIPYFQDRLSAIKKAEKELGEKDFIQIAEILLPLIEKKMVTVQKCPEEEQEQKSHISNFYNDWKKSFLLFLKKSLFRSPEDLKKEAEEEQETVARFLQLANKTQRIYEKAKESRDILDYSDLEQLTLRLVAKKENGIWQKTPILDFIRKEYDAFFIDEYQDTNAIQDMIFRFLGNEKNLFLVGDPKQSIYRFRGAEPSIFSRYKNNLPPYPSKQSGMQKLFLSHNFRCDPPVIDLVNRVFEVLMDQNAPDSLYKPEDRLIPGKKDGDNLSAELVLIQKTKKEEYLTAQEEPPSPQEEEIRNENRESAYVASRIASILNGKEDFQAKPEEIAVICRTGSQLVSLSEALLERNIPCQISLLDQKENGEYLFITSLLQAVENPTLDIPLLGALSSPVFAFSDDALFIIRKEAPKAPFYTALCRYAEKEDETGLRCREFLAQFKKLRDHASEKPLSAFLFEIYQAFLPDELYAQKGEKSELREYFLEKARQAEKMNSPDIHTFLHYLEEDTAQTEESGNGGVKLMTIHKSKGLEFSVVFVSFLAKHFSSADQSAPIAVHRDYGLTSLIPRLGGKARFSPLFRQCIGLKTARENKEEEKRILYVAMTRAKKKLILTASPSSFRKMKRDCLAFCEKTIPDRLLQNLLSSRENLLSMLLISLREDKAVKTALREEKDCENLNFSVRFATDLNERYETEEKERSLLFSFPELKPILDFSYQGSGSENLPKKLSVSEILKGNREEEFPEFYPRRLLDFQKGTLRTNAAQIGTATHQVMQFIRFDKAKENLQEELDRLLEKGFLSPEDMALVDPGVIHAFFHSSLYQEIAASRWVEHEKRFYVLIPAEELLMQKGEILVQGVVDVWFENPDGTLSILDFKTDRVNKKDGEAILVKRHGDQLRLYKTALEKLTGKSVSRLILYSFSLSKAIMIPLK